METIEIVVTAVRYITAGIVIFTVASAAVIWFTGIGPALWRLGNGFAKRKICIFAKNEMGQSLSSLLIDSKLFKAKNIHHVTGSSDLGKCEATTLFLVYWPDWQDNVEEILKQKRDGTALIVYAPQDKGSIPLDVMKQLNEKRNVVLSNFRGRLLNDIVISMITTGYKQQ